MDGNTALVVVLGFIAVMLAIGVALLVAGAVLVYRYRLPLRGIAAMAAGFVYLASPIDVLPEAVLGPFGLVDDLGVAGAVTLFVYRLVQSRRGRPGGRAGAGMGTGGTVVRTPGTASRR